MTHCNGSSRRLFAVLTCAWLLLAMLAAAGRAQTVLFMDDMNDPFGGNWLEVGSLDSAAEFGFDYATVGVPAAPNGPGDTVGLKTVVNVQENFLNEIALVHFDQQLSGQFTVQADVWLNWAPDNGGPGTGTTEFAGIGVGHEAAAPGREGAHFLYGSDGDCGNCDYRLQKDLTHLRIDSGQYAVAGQDNRTEVFLEAFPSFAIEEAVPTQGSSGTQAAGAGGYQWMTITMAVDTTAVGSGPSGDPGLATVWIQSARSGGLVEIGTIDNSLSDIANQDFPAKMDGSVALIMADLFSSLAVNPDFAFALFDNVKVVDGFIPPEPPVEPFTADFDSDGDVDRDDFFAWQNGFGTAAGATRADGDSDDDGDVDGRDHLAWQAQLGSVTGSAALAVRVPEPTAVVSAALAAILFLFARLRRGWH